MTPKELENLVHQYNMDGELDVTCIGSLYSTFKGDWGIPTLLYLGGDLWSVSLDGTPTTHRRHR